jgi:hypothetical protein
MKVIIKGRLSEENLEYAAKKLVEILKSNPITNEDVIARRRANHLRVMGIVDELGIVGREARQAKYNEIFYREEEEKMLQLAIEGYRQGKRTVCDLDKLDYYDYSERMKKLFYEE